MSEQQEQEQQEQEQEQELDLTAAAAAQHEKVWNPVDTHETAAPTLPEGSLAETLQQMKTRVLPLDAIKPYWRNPRRVPEEAVEALIASMRRYGYQQPLVVDEHNVIIVGHTRYAALRKMGVPTILVVVADLPPEKAKEYRLVDNRTGELTSWDYNSLILELREWDDSLLQSFFPEIDLGVGELDADRYQVTMDQIEAAEAKVRQLPGWEPVESVEIVCPSCFHTFEIRKDSVEALLVGTDGNDQ